MTDKLLHKNHSPVYCSTPTAKRIHNLLATCRRHSMMGMIVGEPGTGKTTAAEAFVSAEKGSFLCRITKATSELQPMLVRLCEALGGHSSPNYSKADLYEDILSSLNAYSYHTKLLILDEAQHLSDDALECIRDLFDEARVGIVLIGNKGVKRWESSRKNKRSNSFAQLRGRIGPMLELKTPLEDDLTAICTLYNLQSDYELVRKVARTEGQLHLVAKLIQVASKLAEEGKPIKLDNLKTAAHVIGVNL